jgi:photosystem II stability/assembly factor-like uncharacterized protein
MKVKLKVFLMVWVLVLFAAGCAQPSAPTVMPSSTPIDPATPAPPATETPVPVPTAVPTEAGLPVTLVKIKMLDEKSGWGVGQVSTSPFQRILQTQDGGFHWQDVTPAQPVAESSSLETSALTAFQDADRAWVLYFTPLPAPVSKPLVVWSTTDAGKTWQASKLLEMPTNMDFFMPTDLGFSSQQNGWLMAHLGVGMSHDYVALYRTVNGGADWQRVVDPSQDGVIQDSLPMSCQKTGVVFQDAITGWVTGACNGVVPGLFLYQTTDGGTTWQPVQLPAPSSNPGLLSTQENVCTTNPPAIPPANTIVIMVSCLLSGGQTQGWLYTSQDTGKTWTAQALPAAYGTLDFLPSGTGWLFGGESQDPNEPKTLYQTTDQGKTWKPVLQQVKWHGSIDFINALTGWAIARQNDVNHLLETTNAGKNWGEINARVVK